MPQHGLLSLARQTLVAGYIHHSSTVDYSSGRKLRDYVCEVGHRARRLCKKLADWPHGNSGDVSEQWDLPAQVLTSLTIDFKDLDFKF
jgi:hypothetical protein